MSAKAVGCCREVFNRKSRSDDSLKDLLTARKISIDTSKIQFSSEMHKTDLKLVFFSSFSLRLPKTTSNLIYCKLFNSDNLLILF